MKKSFLRPLSIAVIRRLILIAIMFILFWNVTYWIGEAWNRISGVVWGVGTALVAIFCRYKATRSIKVNKAFIFWMTVPAVLMVIPFIIHVAKVLKNGQASGWTILWQMAPVLISLILPVGLLAVAYMALKHHLPPESNETPPASDKPSDSTPPAT